MNPDDKSIQNTRLEDIIFWKGYYITILYVSRGEYSKDYYNAYVLLKKRNYKDLPNITFGTSGGKLIGVDTAHYENFEMTMTAKKESALKQIKKAIKTNEAKK